MGETQTAFISITTPGIWFGNLGETRRMARRENEYGARMCSDFKGRFALLAVLPLPDVDARLKEIEYAYDTLKGGRHRAATSWNEKWLGDPQFRPVLQELNRRNAAIFTHGAAPSCCGGNWGPGVGETTIEYNTDVSRTIISLIQSGAANETPNIRYMMSHGGGTIIGLSGRFLGNEASAESLAKTPAPEFEASSSAPVLLRHSRIEQSHHHWSPEATGRGKTNYFRYRPSIWKQCTDGSGFKYGRINC